MIIVVDVVIIVVVVDVVVVVVVVNVDVIVIEETMPLSIKTIFMQMSRSLVPVVPDDDS